MHEIPNARLTKNKIPGQKRPRFFKKQGPTKIIARDDKIFLSGVRTLYLTSTAAQELRGVKYNGSLFIHCCPNIGQVERIYEILWEFRQYKNYGKPRIMDKCPIMYEEIDYDNYNFETESFPVIQKECIPRDI